MTRNSGVGLENYVAKKNLSAKKKRFLVPLNMVMDNRTAQITTESQFNRETENVMYVANKQR